MSLYFLSFRDNEIAQVFEIYPSERERAVDPAQSIPLLMVPGDSRSHVINGKVIGFFPLEYSGLSTRMG